MYIYKLFYCILLSTCLCSHLHKHFVVQIVSFCPTQTHSTLVDIVVCLVHVCLRTYIYVQSVVLLVDYLLSICVHMYTYTSTSVLYILLLTLTIQALYQKGP